jgi:protein involved in polysaccharide export with SLBB domain
MIRRGCGFLALCLIGLAGCAGGREQLRQALIHANHPVLARDLAAHYVIRCPDVLAVQVAGRPDLSLNVAVGPNGCINLAGQALHVAGHTVPRAAALLAQRLRLPPTAVRVEVSAYNSQHLYLVGGDIASGRQVVSYRGPETVVDLLRRIDLGQGAELGEIRVVRAHVADGKPPEVFHVDLHGVLMDRDASTNIRLEPSDHIHIGQRQPSKVDRCLPPWLRAAFEPLFGRQ